MKSVRSVLVGFFALKLVSCSEYYRDEKSRSDLNLVDQMPSFVYECEASYCSTHQVEEYSDEDENQTEVKSLFILPSYSDIRLTKEDSAILIELKDIKDNQKQFFLALSDKLMNQKVFTNDKTKGKLAEYLFKLYVSFGTSDRREVDENNQFIDNFLNFLVTENQYDLMIDLLPEEVMPTLVRIQDDDARISGFFKALKNSRRSTCCTRYLSQVSKSRGFPIGKWIAHAIINGLDLKSISFMISFDDRLTENFVKTMIQINLPIRYFDEIRSKVDEFFKAVMPGNNQQGNWEALYRLLGARYHERVYEKLLTATGLGYSIIEDYCAVSDEDFNRFLTAAKESSTDLEKLFAFHFLNNIHRDYCSYRKLENLKANLSFAFEH